MAGTSFSDAVRMASVPSLAQYIIGRDEVADLSSDMFNSTSTAGSDNLFTTYDSTSPLTSFTPVNSKVATSAYSFGADYPMSLASSYPSLGAMSEIEGNPSAFVDPSATWSAESPDYASPFLKHEEDNSWSRQHNDMTSKYNMRHQSRHGQLTPPDDLSPLSQAGADAGNKADIVEEAKVQQHKASTGGRKRRSKATEAAKDEGSAPKKSRRKSSVQIIPTGDPEEDEKREKFLERNRVAASKCRQKKKEWTEALEDDERQQKALNTYLTRYVAQLKEELLFLKGECLKHTDCNCVDIREYMRSTISKMHRPSQTLYAQNPFGSISTSASSMNNARTLSISQPSPGSAHSMQTEDDDMNSLLAASLASHAS